MSTFGRAPAALTGRRHDDTFKPVLSSSFHIRDVSGMRYA